MHLTYVYHSEFNETSAHGKAIIHTCNSLVRHGHEVSVVSAGSLEEFAEANDMEINFSVTSVIISTSFNVIDKTLYFIIALITAFKNDSHVIYTRDIRFLKFLSILPSPVKRKPIIYEAHKLYHKLLPMKRNAEKSYLNEAEEIIAISEGVREDLLDMGLSNIDVVTSAAPLELVPNQDRASLRAEIGLQNEGVIFVYAGTFTAWKNDLKGVIQGFSEISKEYDAYLLLIGGKNSQVSKLERYARTLGLDRADIEFTGRIPHKEVFPYLKAADLGIVPLKEKDDYTSRYTSPVKMYEYLVSGLQIIGSDVPAVANVAMQEPAITVYSRKDESSFAEASRSIIESSSISRDPYQYSYMRRAKKIEQSIIDLSTESS